jgi:hypothetical protein
MFSTLKYAMISQYRCILFRVFDNFSFKKSVYHVPVAAPLTDLKFYIQVWNLIIFDVVPLAIWPGHITETC